MCGDLFCLRYSYLTASHLSALRDDDRQLRLRVRADGDRLDLADGEHAVDHLAEDDVLVVQPVAGVAGEEELGQG